MQKDRKLRIAYIGLASNYTENMTYQDNYFVEERIKKGYEVMCVSNANKYVDRKSFFTGLSINKYNDFILIRLPFVEVINSYIS